MPNPVASAIRAEGSAARRTLLAAALALPALRTARAQSALRFSLDCSTKPSKPAASR